MAYTSIYKAINDSGLKKRYIAERIGVSEQTLSSMIAGKRKITVDEFFGICQVLNKKPEELYNYATAEQAV